MTLLTQAVIFAAMKHDGALRKGTEIPYLVHPMEAAAIAASLTGDEELIAAAVLHDVIEDCGVSARELEERFGARVARLVFAESQISQGDPKASWEARKSRAVERLRSATREEKLIALCDKLSNMRAISRDYERYGEAVFFKFHQHDKRRHAWYYRSCLELLRDEWEDTDAWQELRDLVLSVFPSQQEEILSEKAV
ncbi:MAG: HD domain-containing protein [Clostridia bacterium]|nr:HD domain-containing protein [Clostridia bacterium]